MTTPLPVPDLPGTADVVVVGAGLVGACCALELTGRGRSVLVLDQGAIAAGATAAGEGNLLVSDKTPGPELDLAVQSRWLWDELAEHLGGEIELEAKGGVMVARTGPAAAALRTLAAAQRTAGVRCEEVGPSGAAELEPALTADLVTAVHYPRDGQVQPVLAATRILAAARAAGATVRPGTEVTRIRPEPDGTLTVTTPAGTVSTPAVVVAAGAWSGRVAALAGGTAPVTPRRGTVLVTEPLPPTVRHKVYDAGYLDAVHSDDAGMVASPVIESTRSGTILIGSTRERVGFDRTLPVATMRLLAAGAVRLFPALAGARVMRCYAGFRPYSPDHLPIIGADASVPGLWHATGHEGGGIGLAPGTARLLAELMAGEPPSVPAEPFRPGRPGLTTTEPQGNA